MKKITFVLTFLLIFGIMSDLCRADSYKYVPYAGVSYQFSRTQNGAVRPEYQAGGVYVGSEYSKYFSTELFFNQSASKNSGQDGYKLKSSYRAYGLDLLAYLPVGCFHKFSLIATAGVGEYVFKLKPDGYKHYNEHGYGYRFGGGFKYNWNARWQTRALVRYVKFDKVKNVNQSWEYALSMEYHF